MRNLAKEFPGVHWLPLKYNHKWPQGFQKSGQELQVLSEKRAGEFKYTQE